MIEIPTVREASDRAPEIRPGCQIEDAASMLRDPDVPALLVRDSSDELAGIVTESDIVATVAEGGVAHEVRSCMSMPVVTIPPTTPIGLAADRMREAGVSVLPVVDEDGEYHGLVTRTALAPYLSRQRLDITWDGEPIVLDDTSPDAA